MPGRLPALIVGAGPTGLVLALSLARRGVPFRLVSEAAGPGEHSRAMVVHARTLEFYRQLGFADEVLAAGLAMQGVHLREGGAHGGSREVTSFSFADIGRGLSPFPTPIAFPQDDHERLLVAKLEAAGGTIGWGTRLVTFTQDEGGISATLAHADGRSEAVRADYICGCDGAHSATRATLALGFPGGTYPQLYYVVDCTIAGGFEPDLVVNLGRHALALLLPVRSRGVQRLIGLVPPEVPEKPDLGFEDLRPHVEPLIDRRVTSVSWFATYRVHHRVAEHFRVGRAFLLGDAGHIHSPAGGQGMNTGIGDAVNLGWKLAMVAQGRAAAALLDTYEPERIGFARQLVATTDRAFTPLVAGGLKGEVVRRLLVPLLFAVGSNLPAARRALFRLVSQIAIEYEASEISEGEAGQVKAGDRLPWLADGDNFAPLASLDWQLHVYGTPQAGLREACAGLRLPVHVFPWSDAAAAAGFRRDAACLVRPDGHVALAGADLVGEALRRYAAAWRLGFAGG